MMNKYIEDTKPWILWKEKSMNSLNSFIWSLLEGIRVVAICVYPFMPGTAEKILAQLNRPLDKLGDLVFSLQDFTINKESPLFPRIDVD